MARKNDPLPLSQSLSSYFNIIKSPSPVKPKQSKRYKSCAQRKDKPVKCKPQDPNPSTLPFSLGDDEIKRRTGFQSEVAMLSFAINVCNGNFDLFKETNSILTWYEEWLLYFEAVWGKTHTRMNDLAVMFKTQNETVYEIFDCKIHLILRCRSSWPTYASYDEDRLLRKAKWNSKYDGKRIIMWDDTNVPFQYKPSSARNQRLTYSSYYGMNCAKGGVFLQLCSWMGVAELWVGGTSDSHFMEHTDILKQQEEFARSDLVGGKYLPFSLILDKGYRIIAICWKKGQQVYYQPIFASSDRRFTLNETPTSAGIAADRSGNERAVNTSKKSSTYVEKRA